MAIDTIRTTCSYCSVGCNFDATIENGNVTDFQPNRVYPVNLGSSCPKGFRMLDAFSSPERATQPLLRGADGVLQPASWDDALTEMVGRFKSIKEKHGPESVAFISTGQMPTEELALLGAVFKFGMGFFHADGNTRQCMATAAVAYKQSFGFDAPPYCYDDFAQSDLLVFIGANPVITHPVMWNRVKKNKLDASIVVLDPRLTKTAKQATTHVALRPKSDMVFINGVCRELIERGWIDRGFVEAHTEGFAGLKQHVAEYTPEVVGARAGVPASMVVELAQQIHRAKAASFWWTMGVNQSHQGVRTAQSIINLCLLTGNIGRPGTGPNSITGQANAMGSRLFSNTTAMFGGMDFLKEGDRRRIAEILGIDVGRIPDKNGMLYHKILEAVDSGSIKGLWIIATNPSHSWRAKNGLTELLGKLDFLVVQDLYANTETAILSDLFLPAAGSGEKSGTFINSERRIGIVDKVMQPPGEAMADFEIFKAIADKWGCGEMFAEWTSPEAAFGILQRSSAGRPCDITGIDGYEMLRSRGGVQWPYPADGADPKPERRLFADHNFHTPSGRAKFVFEEEHPVPEEIDGEFPFVLLTGRGSVAQWHTQTRTGKIAVLNRLRREECFIQINSADAESLGIGSEDCVSVHSRRGSVVVEAMVTDEVQAGQVFMPMHYHETNLLTFPAFDPYSAEPAYKYSAVNIERSPVADREASLAK